MWSLLLGIALLCPALLFLTLFPVSLPTPTQPDTLKFALFPGTMVLLHVLLGPLLEEVVYRGLFLQLARRYMPAWIAIVLSSAIFAATHFMKGAAVTLLAFPMGCLFAWMTLRTRSLFPGFLCHAVFNYVGVLSVVAWLFSTSEKVLAMASNTKIPVTELFPVWWIVLSIVMTVISSIMLRREFARHAPATDAGRQPAPNMI
jgi:membrane protease YdiL (CAAX protease family)